MNLEEAAGAVAFVLFGLMAIVFRREITERYLSVAKRVFGVAPTRSLDTTPMLIGGIVLVIVGIMTLVLR